MFLEVRVVQKSPEDFDGHDRRLDVLLRVAPRPLNTERVSCRHIIHQNGGQSVNTRDLLGGCLVYQQQSDRTGSE